MTVQGSVAAIPAFDDAWDDQADNAFFRFLPVALDDVLAASGYEAMMDAIARGAEELVFGVEAEVEAANRGQLGPTLLDEHIALNGTGADTSILSVVFHPDRVGVRIPLTSRGVTVGHLDVAGTDGRWIGAQQRAQLRRYADLVAPMLHESVVNEALRAAALTDELTGLANRRALDRELDRFCAAGLPVCLLLLDIDGLKEVNDTLGYEQGDHLIQALAKSLVEVVGEHAVAARMGGDEFVVILPGSTEKKVRKQARRVRRTLARQPLPPGVAALSGGVSVGVVEGRPGETPRQLLRRAARSMRTQKRRRASDRR
jgi:diguanylate cyclase (GGDEF)-like protein